MAEGKKSGLGRKLAIVAGVLVVLLVVVYFVATSAFFLKSVILPKVGKSMNATVTVADASISPFSQVILRDLKVTTTAPLVEAREVRLRYALMDIIKGNINVHELTLDSPVVTIVKDAEGKSNLDPILNQPKKADEPKSSSEPTKLDVKNVALKNATVRMTENVKGGGANVTELTGVNITVDQLKNGGSSKLTIASDLKMDQAGTNHLGAKVAGNFDFALTPALAPQSIKGSTRIDINRAEGTFKDAAGMVAILEADASPTDLKNVGLRFEKGGQQLGQLRVHGPFDLAKSEGSLAVELLNLDRNVLNLAGMDFAQSKINSTNKVDITKAGKVVAVNGRVTGNQLGIVREQQPTPPVDLDFAYKLAADLDGKKATVDQLSLSARHKNSEFLQGGIDQPLTVNWGGAASQVPDSTLRLVVTNLNLADWKAMMGTNPPAGIVNANVRLVAQNQGKKLGLDLATKIDQLTISNTLENARIELTAKGAVDDMKRVNISDYQLAVWTNNVALTKLNGNARYDLEKGELGAHLAASGGTVDIDGAMNSEKKSGKVNFKIQDINQTLLAPFVAKSLGEKKLASISINGSGAASYGPEGNDVKADLNITNLVVLDPKNPGTNRLAVGLNVDASQRGDQMELRDLALKLTPTARAENRLHIQGKVDLSTNKPSPATLTIKSPGLDLTPYYDMFAGGKSTNVAAVPPVSTNAPAEPEPMNLPLKQATASIDIQKLFLREIAISNWVTTATISNNNIHISPLNLAINGAPVKGDVSVNVGVPGYAYNLALNLDRVPVEPLANTFVPQDAGKYKGLLVADANIKGVGTLGASLQKNLQGHANFSVTNLDLAIVGPKIKRILVPISLVLRVPELLQTPINWVDARTKMGDGKITVEKMGVESEAFYANVTGDIAINKVLTNSTLQLPVELSLRRSLAEKSMLLSRDTPTNARFAALPKFVTVKGTLGEPDPDINKLALGGVLLRAGAGLTGNAIGGNAGAALDLITGQRSGTNAAGTNASAGAKLIQGLGGLLGGNKGTNTVVSTNAPGTNAPATNAPVQNLLNIFKKPK